MWFNNFNSPLTKPFIKIKYPFGSNKGFNLSKTVGLQKLTLSNKIQCPFVMLQLKFHQSIQIFTS